MNIENTFTPTTPVKRKRRVFMWTFLTIQALFVIWIIAGITGQDSGELCKGITYSAKTCADAVTVGTGIGVMLIVGLWVAVDFILAVSYGIYRLASRKAGV